MRALITEPLDFSSEAKALLAEHAAVDEGPFNRSELKDVIGAYDIVWSRLGHLLDAELLRAAGRLKIIVTATTGLNHIDQDMAKANGVAILSLAGERAFLDTIHATAEHTMALLLGLIRRLPASVESVKGGAWDRDKFKGTELQGRTLGIVGYGRLGTKVAQYAQAFGMRILVHDRAPVSVPAGIEPVTLDELLAQSDVVSLHISGTAENDRFFDAAKLRAMKKGALLLNTARGDVVDEAALLAALQSGDLGSAALDVLRGETGGQPDWLARDPLIGFARTHDNLLITPHTGGATYDSMAKTEIFMARKLHRFLETQP